jgi:DNA repair exonuclease SbcCD ATPase subunit
MFKIKNITVKNFMSVGNQTQAVDFDREHLTLVLGENLDLGGDDSGSRNGTGKTTIINSLSYALYGQALTNIRKENLINKINGKNMLVTVEFEKDGIKYRIERGRKPNVLRLFINDKEQESAGIDDDAQGDSRETQKFIDQCLGMSHTMFKHLVALNTYTEPFLSMKAADQREVIEQLLGITMLSEKAEALKLQAKEVRDTIQIEQIKIETTKSANESVQKSIDSLVIKSKAWDSKKETDLENLAKAIATLESVDIAEEINKHAALKIWEEKNSQLNDLKRQRATYQTAHGQAEKNVKRYQRDSAALGDKKCPQCEQNLQDHTHQNLIADAARNLKDSSEYLDSINKNLETIENKIKDINNIGHRPITFYDSEADALNHKNQLDNLEKALEAKANESNPYQEQIEELQKTAIQEINWDTINSLTKVKDHQEFLLKLLTNKESFIRKKIIDQNLNYLNKRLSYYIDVLGLPHLVVFQNDLNVEITNFGQDLDFDNLSRGERNRLILGMSFAFRDVWENLYQNINLLFIDELIDSGMDSAGVEAGLGVLKKIARERNKNIYLISHKEELIGRVNKVLRVIKESGFTSYSNSAEYIETQ